MNQFVLKKITARLSEEGKTLVNSRAYNFEITKNMLSHKDKSNLKKTMINQFTM